MTEPNEPEDAAPAEDPTEDAPEATSAEVDEVAEPDEVEDVAADTDPDAAEEPEPEAAEPAITEEPAEPVTLPDESHSRTSELAARLRQSALAQVEAARQTLAPEGGTSEAAAADPEKPSGPTIPALDDPRATTPRVPEPKPDPEPDREPLPMSEPIAVAAAAVAEATANGGQSFLSGPAEPEPSKAAGRVRTATVVGLVLAIALGVVAVVFSHSSSNKSSVADARTAALAAATPEVAAALTYDYRTLEADFAAAEKGMSTKFRANYARTAATSVTPLATQTNASTTGSVAAAGVISASADRVLVLAFANQVSTNKNLGGKNRLDLSVIEVTMIKEGDRWVIDDLKPF